MQEARELGIGFLYEDAKGMVKEDEEKVRHAELPRRCRCDPRSLLWSPHVDV